MEIKLEEQSPDGINISVSNLIVDSIEEAKEFTEWIIKIWGMKKIDIEECCKIYEKLTEQIENGTIKRKED